MNSIKSLLALLVLSPFTCNSITESIKSTPPIEARIEVNGVVFTLTLSKNTFALSDTLKGTFRVSNQSGDAQRYDFANIQQLGFRLSDADGKVSLYQPFIVSPALSSLQLQSGDSKEYPIFTTFTDHTGKFVDPGEYTLAAFLLDNNSPEVTLKITVT